MKREIDRRIFIKKSLGATLGAMVLPNAAHIFESCNTESQSQNYIDNIYDSPSNLDWREMMKDHDLLWKKVPADMTEAPHFGNGLIGSMIWIDACDVDSSLTTTRSI